MSSDLNETLIEAPLHFNVQEKFAEPSWSSGHLTCLEPRRSEFESCNDTIKYLLEREVCAINTVHIRFGVAFVYKILHSQHS